MIEKLAPVAFAAMALLGVAANGAFDYHTATFSSILNGPDYSVSLPKFDPALGTLQSIKFQLGGTAQAILTFDNESNIEGNVALTYGFSTTATTDNALSTSLMANFFNASGNGAVKPDNDGAADFMGTDAFAISAKGSTDVYSSLLTGAPYLSQYTAGPSGSTFSVKISNATAEDVGPTTTAGIFGATRQSNGWLNEKVTVAYAYALSPVPEAVTTLWGACLGLFALGRRKRLQRA